MITGRDNIEEKHIVVKSLKEEEDIREKLIQKQR